MRARVGRSNDVHCLKGVVYFGKQRTLSRTNKTGKYIFGENILHQLWSDSYLRVYVIAALQIIHGIAYELEMGDYDLQ
jgi:hypothetical protein